MRRRWQVRLPAVKGTPRRKSIQRLVSLLDSARRLLVVLSADIPNEAVESSLLLAKKYGALLAVEDETGHLLSGAMQTAGYLTGTLGDAHNAQAVLLCGVDPGHTHPRLGDFLGADLWKNAISLNPPDPFAALRWLRLGWSDPSQPVPKKLETILAHTRSASSGIVFFGAAMAGGGTAPGGRAAALAARPQPQRALVFPLSFPGRQCPRRDRNAALLSRLRRHHALDRTCLRHTPAAHAGSAAHQVWLF